MADSSRRFDRPMSAASVRPGAWNEPRERGTRHGHSEAREKAVRRQSVGTRRQLAEPLGRLDHALALSEPAPRADSDGLPHHSRRALLSRATEPRHPRRIRGISVQYGRKRFETAMGDRGAGVLPLRIGAGRARRLVLLAAALHGRGVARHADGLGAARFPAAAGAIRGSRRLARRKARAPRDQMAAALTASPRSPPP
jgi:hypothetical protein